MRDLTEAKTGSWYVVLARGEERVRIRISDHQREEHFRSRLVDFDFHPCDKRWNRILMDLRKRLKASVARDKEVDA